MEDWKYYTLWQVCIKFGGYWRPTIEFLQADNYEHALEELLKAVADGKSGFKDSGELDVREVNAIPLKFRGVDTVMLN